MISEGLKKFAVIGNDLFISPEGVHEAREDTIFLANTIETKPTDTVLEIGVGMGVSAVILGKKVKQFYGVDVNEEAVMCTRMNGYINNLRLEDTVLVGDCFEPFKDLKFDTILSNPPQLPTPKEKERFDWIGWANNGGNDGRKLIDKIVDNAHNHLKPNGCLYLLHFDICDTQKTLNTLAEKGFKAEIIKKKEVSFGKLSYERLDYILDEVCKDIKLVDDKYYFNISIVKATKI
jgi:release factor glutamine methyltransferase